LSQFDQTEPAPPVPARSIELRYRIADWMNDCLHALPVVHGLLRRLLSRSAPEPGSATRVAAAPSGDDQAKPQSEKAAIHAKVAPVSLDALAYPPVEMRALIGTTDTQAFDNPEGKLVFNYLDFGQDPAVYERVFDFGCGCGRMARQFLLQRPQPKHYVGIDLHAGMIRWCKANLEPAASGFEFHHHDVFNVSFNRKAANQWTAAFPVGNAEFSLVIAHSVFTHLTEQQAIYYLRECARILDAEGYLYSSWFLFDKQDYPMLYEFNNALYVSYDDPSSAVIFDKHWLRERAHEAGLRICGLIPPSVRGHQWAVIMTHRRDLLEPDFPVDSAPRGVMRASLVHDRDPEKIGLEQDTEK
jgi:SAM-dependent methyltransferase